MAFTMLMPNIPADPKHEDVYNQNIDLGYTIKRLVDEKKIRLDGFDKDFKIKVSVEP